MAAIDWNGQVSRSQFLGLFAVAVAMTCAVGHDAGIPFLTSLSNGLVTMKPVTAFLVGTLGLVVTIVPSALRGDRDARSMARFGSALVLLVVAATALLMVFGAIQPTHAPAPLTLHSMFCLGLCGVLSHFGAQPFRLYMPVFAWQAIAIGFVALFGYLVGLGALYWPVASQSGVAMNTAIALIAIGASFIFSARDAS